MLRKKTVNEFHYRRLYGHRRIRFPNQSGSPSFEKLDSFASQAHIYLVGRARQRINILSVSLLDHRQFAGVPLVQPSHDALTKSL